MFGMFSRMPVLFIPFVLSAVGFFGLTGYFA